MLCVRQQITPFEVASVHAHAITLTPPFYTLFSLALLLSRSIALSVGRAFKLTLVCSHKQAIAATAGVRVESIHYIMDGFEMLADTTELRWEHDAEAATSGTPGVVTATSGPGVGSKLTVFGPVKTNKQTHKHTGTPPRTSHLNESPLASLYRHTPQFIWHLFYSLTRAAVI